MYGGAFGAHVAAILRRLWRLAAMYRAATPGAAGVADAGYRYACCSATLGNPRELFQSLTGLSSPLRVVDTDGAPHGRRQLVLWQPPIRAEPMQIPEGRGVPQDEPSPQPASAPNWAGAGVGAGAAASARAPDGVSVGPVLAPPLTAGSATGRARHPLTADARATADEVKRESANIEGAVLFAEMVRAGLKVHSPAGCLPGRTVQGRWQATCTDHRVDPRRPSACHSSVHTPPICNATPRPHPTSHTRFGASPALSALVKEGHCLCSALLVLRVEPIRYLLPLLSTGPRPRRSPPELRAQNPGTQCTRPTPAVLSAQVICFCSVRKICELVLDYARQHLSAVPGSKVRHGLGRRRPDLKFPACSRKAPSVWTSPLLVQDLARQISAYRGGLSATDRRRIERQLYDGTLRGVTATSTLELGVRQNPNPRAARVWGRASRAAVGCAAAVVDALAGHV